MAINNHAQGDRFLIHQMLPACKIYELVQHADLDVPTVSVKEPFYRKSLFPQTPAPSPNATAPPLSRQDQV